MVNFFFERETVKVCNDLVVFCNVAAHAKLTTIFNLIMGYPILFQVFSFKYSVSSNFSRLSRVCFANKTVLNFSLRLKF